MMWLPSDADRLSWQTREFPLEVTVDAVALNMMAGRESLDTAWDAVATKRWAAMKG